MAKPVVFVIGASGTIGAATVAALSARYADKVEIRAGVRNPDCNKADKLKSLSHVTVVQAHMGEKEHLTSILKGVDVLFINTSSSLDRVQLTLTSAEAAKIAGVKHVVVVSIATARRSDTIFGKQLTEIEDKIPQVGIPYTILRLPFFAENFWGSKAAIVGQGAVVTPANPDVSVAMVTAGDAGESAAVILTDPSKHGGKTYNIISDSTTYNDIARMFSQALGREIRCTGITLEAFKQRLMEVGLQEWRADGLVDLHKLVNDRAPEVNPSDRSDYERITGRKPTSLNEWITSNAPGFQ